MNNQCRSGAGDEADLGEPPVDNLNTEGGFWDGNYTRREPQHFLNFLPLPQGHSSLRPTRWVGNFGGGGDTRRAVQCKDETPAWKSAEAVLCERLLAR